MNDPVIRPDPSRIQEGWEPRFVVEARRVPEYVDLYASLGFEVLADPIARDRIEPGCGDCRIAILLDFRAIYTRRRSTS